MTDFPAPQTHLVLPQVGAILHLDTELPQTNLFEGNKHWKLDGSCALIAEDRALAIRHTLSKTSGSHALFFPYAGFFELGPIQEIDFESRWTDGDYVRVVRIQPSLKTAAALPYAYADWGAVDDVLVSGYGRWRGWPGWEEDGIQRTMGVRLRGSEWEHHRDNLDIGWWSSDHGGLMAGSNNSGGPVLANLNGTLTLFGLNRESVDDDLQSASRIGWERRKWLEEEHGLPAGGVHAAEHPPLGSEESGRLKPELLTIGMHPETVETVTFEVPEGASKVQATLSATPGIRLKMALGRGAAIDLHALAPDDGPSGRFLYRDLPLDGADEITIAVAPVATAPATVAQVQAQLCVMFT